MSYYLRKFMLLRDKGIDDWYIRLYMIDKICYPDFPSWEEYKTLFDGSEYDEPTQFMDCYDRHKEEFYRTREENNIDY